MEKAKMGDKFVKPDSKTIYVVPEKSVKRDASHSKTFKTLGILDVHF